MKPKSKQTQAVDDVQAEIKAYLAPLGFKCRGRNFNRKINEDLIQVVNIWMGPYTSMFHGLISVNLGVYHTGLKKAFNGEHFSECSWVPEPACFIRKRLGKIGDGDRWWEPNSASATEILRLLKLDQSLFFGRYSTIPKILEELYSDFEHRGDFQSPKRIVAAALKLHQGDRTEASKLLQEQAETSRAWHPGHADYVLELAQRLGLSNL